MHMAQLHLIALNHFASRLTEVALLVIRLGRDCWVVTCALLIMLENGAFIEFAFVRLW